MNVPIGIAAIVGFLVIAELGRLVVAKLFGYQAERHAIPIMKLPGSRGSQGFRLALILAGPVTIYLTVAILAFCFFRCQTTAIPEQARTIEGVLEGHDAAGKLVPGDVILEVDGAPFAGGPARLRDLVNAKQGAAVTIAIERAAAKQTVTVMPTQRDGRWVLGVALAPLREPTGTGAALKEAIVYPAAQVARTFQGLIEIFKGSDRAEAGGPVRIVDEFRTAFDGPSGAGLVLLTGMIFGTWALIALSLFDLVRALLLILFRS